MKLLVTGGAGFIGSAVVRLAVARGHAVVNLDALTYAACPENVAGVADSPLYAFEHADIRDRTALARIFAEHAPDAVMHLAAEKFTEDTPYDPRSPYSASKAASDHLVRAWWHTYGLPVLLTNCSNNYGPYHFPEKLIPVIILNALADRPLPVYGDGSNIRDWLYVEDHAEALLLVLERGVPGRSYNIGGDNERSNLDLVRTLCALLDELRPRADGRPYADQIAFVSDRPGHDARYAIDPSRIREELGWRPSVTVEQGLRRTAQWYLDNETWWRALQGRDGVGKRLGTG